MVIKKSESLTENISEIEFHELPKVDKLNIYIKMAQFAAKMIEFKQPNIKWFNIVPFHFSTTNGYIKYFTTKSLKVDEKTAYNHLKKVENLGDYDDADMLMFLSDLVFPVDILI
jgi:hypothetical protein